MIKHCGTIDLYTERLYLRQFRMEDAEDIFGGWTSDEKVAKYTSWSTHSCVEDTRGFISYILSKNPSNSYDWIIECDGKIIGTISVCYNNDTIGVAGVAYCFAYNSWGKRHT